MANIKHTDPDWSPLFPGWSWEVAGTYYSHGGEKRVNIIDDGDCRFHFLVDIPSDFPGEFTGAAGDLLTPGLFKHGTERTISHRYYRHWKYLSAWYIRNGAKANQGGFDRFYNNIFRWKTFSNDINDDDAWGNYVHTNNLPNTTLPDGYPGFETAVVYEQGNATLGFPYNMGADAGPNSNLNHNYPPYKYHCDASDLTDVHDIAKYLDRPNPESGATYTAGMTTSTNMFVEAFDEDHSPGRPSSASSDSEKEAWIRSRLQIEQYDITYKTYWGLPSVTYQGEVTWIIKNVTPQHLYDPTFLGVYPEPYLYAYFLTPAEITAVKLYPSAFQYGSDIEYNQPSLSLSNNGMQFVPDTDDEVLAGASVNWCSGGGSGGDSSPLEVIVRGYDIDNNYLGTTDSVQLNIITTNLDLPDEPEPGEFLGNDPNSTEPQSNYEWYDYASIDNTNYYAYNTSVPAFRGSWVNYLKDSTEEAVSNFEAYDDANMRYNVVFHEEPSSDVSDHLGFGHSIFGANRRYYTKKIIDLWFTDGVYAPMSDEVIENRYYLAAPHAFLSQRIGNEADYAASLPVYNENGTLSLNRKYFEPIQGEYSMTFDGFDMDLWQHGTTMRPGFRNPVAPNYWDLSNLGRNVDYYISETLASDGRFFEDSSMPDSPYMFNGKELAAMENYDHLALDGYMYYKGELKMTLAQAQAINPSVSTYGWNKNSLTGEDAIWTRNGTSETYRTFRRTVARKPLSSDHTVQTVVDALKERRSNRTITGVIAHNGNNTKHIDGAIQKFQSGEWYYPSNSPAFGKNYSNVNISSPCFAEDQVGYYFAKDFTIGST